MAISGHVSRRMIEHYSHIRMDAKRRATDAIVEGGCEPKRETNWKALTKLSSTDHGGSSLTVSARRDTRRRGCSGGVMAQKYDTKLGTVAQLTTELSGPRGKRLRTRLLLPTIYFHFFIFPRCKGWVHSAFEAQADGCVACGRYAAWLRAAENQFSS
jgi:hypothetical protein